MLGDVVALLDMRELLPQDSLHVEALVALVSVEATFSGIFGVCLVVSSRLIFLFFLVRVLSTALG